MHTELCQTVARIRRGQLVTVQTQPGMGVVTALFETLPDYGIECVEVRAHQVEDMGDAAFVEMLNDIRLRDQLLIVTGADAERARYNVEHCFTKFGGRAVVVTH